LQRFYRTCLNALPLQTIPFPVYPERELHMKLPTVFLQMAIEVVNI